MQFPYMQGWNANTLYSLGARGPYIYRGCAQKRQKEANKKKSPSGNKMPWVKVPTKTLAESPLRAPRALRGARPEHIVHVMQVVLPFTMCVCQAGTAVGAAAACAPRLPLQLNAARGPGALQRAAHCHTESEQPASPTASGPPPMKSWLPPASQQWV